VAVKIESAAGFGDARKQIRIVASYGESKNDLIRPLPANKNGPRNSIAGRISLTRTRTQHAIVNRTIFVLDKAVAASFLRRWPAEETASTSYPRSLRAPFVCRSNHCVIAATRSGSVCDSGRTSGIADSR